jgi:isopentenyl-diphosphate delta-isomerase
MRQQEVILVNEEDVPLGRMEKMEAHRKGLLHRAFSVFIFDSRGRMLLQQRAQQKYHGANLRSNACCSHPFADENVEAAALRRLQEELGFTTGLEKIFEFTYKAEVENNLTEHEYDHVFIGEYEGAIHINHQEVAAVIYEEMSRIKCQINEMPEKFTTWFRLAFPVMETWWQQQYGGVVRSEKC